MSHFCVWDSAMRVISAYGTLRWESFLRMGLWDESHFCVKDSEMRVISGDNVLAKDQFSHSLLNSKGVSLCFLHVKYLLFCGVPLASSLLLNCQAKQYTQACDTEQAVSYEWGRMSTTHYYVNLHKNTLICLLLCNRKPYADHGSRLIGSVFVLQSIYWWQYWCIAFLL